MLVDILTFVNTNRRHEVFRKKKIHQACDNLCRAEALREAAIFKAALLGPRF